MGYTFKQVDDDGMEVVIRNAHPHQTIGDMCEAFLSFLRAVGYSIPNDSQILIHSEEEDEEHECCGKCKEEKVETVVDHTEDDCPYGDECAWCHPGALPEDLEECPCGCGEPAEAVGGDLEADAAQLRADFGIGCARPIQV